MGREIVEPARIDSTKALDQHSGRHTVDVDLGSK
jgi:hypothetical protein